MKMILGEKAGMTQIFKDGKMIPVTVVKAGPCVVIDKKTPEKHGYAALVIGYEDAKEKHLNKPLLGIFKKAKIAPKRVIKEFRMSPDELEKYKIGDEIRVDIFAPGEKVDVSGRTKGRGFQGPVKRFGFKGFPDSHGHRYHRAGGSIGASAFPARVFKGKTMPGHMGTNRITVQNLEVIEVKSDEDTILIKGAVPGATGSQLIIQEAVKAVVKDA